MPGLPRDQRRDRRGRRYGDSERFGLGSTARPPEAMESLMPVSSAPFTGFRPEAVEFLAELAQHNDRAWFQPRKDDYERLLKTPLEGLCAALDAEFLARGIPLMADPAKSPFRIYRDVRFSKDKSPYKTNVGASFAYVERSADGEVTAAAGHRRGGYFHPSPGGTSVGGGIWPQDPEPLRPGRDLVHKRPKPG